jgi:ubiquinone/menaquinone biosynthesis C-methylase UbiE
VAFYKNRVYPALVSLLGNPKPAQALRETIIPLAHGTVLEIGAGAGANFVYYDRAKVGRLYALEPNPGMLRRAATRQDQVPLDIEFLTHTGERVPLEDRSVDTVVCTFTLCTIPALDQALSSIARVLRPNGLLVFLENSLATDPNVQRWQRRWTPIHRRVFQGLVLTRDIPTLIGGAGFQLERLERGCLGRFPKSWSHCCWGTARKR